MSSGAGLSSAGEMDVSVGTPVRRDGRFESCPPAPRSAGLGPGAILSVYLQESRVGSGWREFLLLAMGRRHACLLYVPTLTRLTIPLGDLASAEIHKPRRGLATRIRRIRAERRRFGLSWSGPGTAAALKLARAAP